MEIQLYRNIRSLSGGDARITNDPLYIQIIFSDSHFAGVILHLAFIVVHIAFQIKGTIQDPLPVKFGILGNTRHFLLELLDLKIDGLTVTIRVGTGRRLYSQFAHTLHQRRNFCQCTISRLNHGNAVI